MEQFLFLLPVGGFFAFLAAMLAFGDQYSLNRIKSKQVGDGQYGTARFASEKEVRNTFVSLPYEAKAWRKGEHMPTAQGLLVGSYWQKNKVTAYIDESDVHMLMIGAAGVGKTANFLYPNLEYACAAGMSFLTTDTKGDLFRTYGSIAEQYYGYHIAVIDLRNPTRSHGNNLLHLVNKYKDLYKAEPENLAYKAKSEKYAKIIAKTVINSMGGDTDYGQNAFFYDAAEGLLTASILLIAELCPPEKRHIISVFKIVQDLIGPSGIKGKSQFQVLIEKLPAEHKARWLAGAALYTSDQAMASVLSTVLSRLNAFLDSELEQILCFDTAIDAEDFCQRKSAIFLVMPEEDSTKYPLISLILQEFYREILTVADEKGGKLDNRVILFLDEIGTIPKIQNMEMMFSASRSRRVSIVAIIQSFAQLEKNYGKEGADIITDNCQLVLFGGFAPTSSSAETLSRYLGNQTVLSGSISKGKSDPSQSLQMIQRPLITTDELKLLPKGHFILAKTGCHPMQTELRLFLKWGIEPTTDYEVAEQANRVVQYADKKELEENLLKRYPQKEPEPEQGDLDPILAQLREKRKQAVRVD